MCPLGRGVGGRNGMLRLLRRITVIREEIGELVPLISVSSIKESARDLGLKGFHRWLERNPKDAYQMLMFYLIARKMVSQEEEEMGIIEIRKISGGRPETRAMLRREEFARNMVFDRNVRVLVRRVSEGDKCYVYEIVRRSKPVRRGILEAKDMLILYYDLVPPEVPVACSHIIYRELVRHFEKRVLPTLEDFFNIASACISERDDGVPALTIEFYGEKGRSVSLTSLDLGDFVKDPTEFFANVLWKVMSGLKKLRIYVDDGWRLSNTGKEWVLEAKRYGARVRMRIPDDLFLESLLRGMLLGENPEDLYGHVVTFSGSCEVIYGEALSIRAQLQHTDKYNSLEIRRPDSIEVFYGPWAKIKNIILSVILNEVDPLRVDEVCRDMGLAANDDIRRCMVLLKEVLGDLVKIRGLTAEINEAGGGLKFEIDLLTGDATLVLPNYRTRLCVDTKNYRGLVLKRMGEEFEEIRPSEYEIRILATALPLAFPELRSESLRKEIEYRNHRYFIHVIP